MAPAVVLHDMAARRLTPGTVMSAQIACLLYYLDMVSDPPAGYAMYIRKVCPRAVSLCRAPPFALVWARWCVRAGILTRCLAAFCRTAWQRQRTGRAPAALAPCSAACLTSFMSLCNRSTPVVPPPTVLLNLVLILPGAIAAFSCPIVQVFQGKRLVFDTTYDTTSQV